MLKIKLARFGKNKQPHYRIVVNEARDKRDGKYVALLGHYAPNQKPKVLQVDLNLYQEWLTKGAQPTETVSSLIERAKSGNPFPERPAKLSKKAKAKLEAAKAEKEAAAAAPAEEAPIAEAPVAEAPAAEEALTETAAAETTETPEVTEPVTE